MRNQEIIERYYRDHRDELLQYVSSRLGGDVMAAEDMVQEVFLRLLSDHCRPIVEATVGSLVYTMARHLLCDHYRRLAHQRLYEAHAQAVLPADYRIEPAVYVSDTLRHIEHSLERLPKATASIYRLHLYDGLQCSDIARRLSLDYKTVEYRLGQARRLVRHLLRSAV